MSADGAKIGRHSTVAHSDDACQPEDDNTLCSLCSQPMIDGLLDIGTPVKDVMSLLSTAKGPASIDNEQRRFVADRRKWLIGTRSTGILTNTASLRLYRHMLRNGYKPATVRLPVVDPGHKDDLVFTQERWTVPTGVNDLQFCMSSEDAYLCQQVINRTPEVRTIGIECIDKTMILPSTVKILAVGDDISPRCVLPESIQSVVLGRYYSGFSGLLAPLIRLPALASLCIMTNIPSILPFVNVFRSLSSLRLLTLMGCVDFLALTSTPYCILPPNIETLQLTGCCHRIDHLVLPSQLKRLEFGTSFFESVQRLRFPSSLQQLTLPVNYHIPVEQFRDLLPEGCRVVFSAVKITDY